MKKLGIIILIFITAICYAGTNFNELKIGDIKYYTPTKIEEKQNYELIRKLIALDSGKETWTKNEWVNLISSKKDNGLDTNTILVFFLHTKNSEIRNCVAELAKDGFLEPKFALALMNLYSSTVMDKHSSSQENRYVCANGLFDEDLDLFTLKEVSTFRNALGLLIFQSKWDTIPFPNAKNGSNGFSLFSGGGTSCLRVDLFEYNMTEDKYLAVMRDDKTEHENWTVKEMKTTGIYSNAKIDKLFVGIGYSKEGDESSVIKGDFTIYMYNRAFKKGYIVRYELNCSAANNNYQTIEIQFQRLAFMLNYVWFN